MFTKVNLASLAQLVERMAVNHKVAGSNPARSVFYFISIIKYLSNVYKLFNTMKKLGNFY